MHINSLFLMTNLRLSFPVGNKGFETWELSAQIRFYCGVSLIYEVKLYVKTYTYTLTAIWLNSCNKVAEKIYECSETNNKILA